MASQSSRVRQPPVGFAGVLTMRSLVLAVTNDRNSSTSSLNALLSRIGAETARAPTKSTSELYTG